MRVFLSHSARDSVSAVRQILAALGAEVVDPFDPNAADSLEAALPDAIRQIDALVAVVDKHSPNVFYELGLAAAMGKPVLVLQAPETVLPPFLVQVHHVTSDFRDSKALRFAIEQFLKQIGNSVESPSKPRRLADAAPRSAQLKELARALGELRLDGTSMDAERILGAFLKAANVRAVERGPTDEKGADLAIWSDGISSTLGNPILVELKTGRIEQMNFGVAYSNLAYAVQAAAVATGLLLYLDRRGQRFGKPNTWVPNVFLCDLEDFASSVVRVGFDRTLLDLRNEHVHGVGR